MGKLNAAGKTRSLLWGGILAGPVYLVVSVFQIMIRDGFDVSRHSWSLLSNGELGWIHVTNFLVTGALTLLGALGLRRVLHGQRGGTWGPFLLMVYGVGLMAAGVFKADPVDGFPPGTPSGPPASVSTSGVLHLLSALIGFIALVAACIVFFRHFRSTGKNGLAWFSLLTGIFFLVGFIGLIGGPALGDIGLTVAIFLFIAVLVLSWTWYGLVSWYYKREALASIPES